ncbi:hypothetical protein AB6735_00285 [Mucilaginibacter sp. RCC_168]|uniref:hypothetical protein n=1 Tax=Mucilaginibacter sp. RCC_168 TaxID=3239221 RepID=UPI003524743B
MKITIKKLLILLTITLAPFFLRAQNTIGKSREEIRNIIRSNPKFKLLVGDNCDTLVFAQGMQAIFEYKNNLCYKSISVLPLQYMPSIIGKMTTDSYKKINDNTWIDSKETIQVAITIDKKRGVFIVTTTSYEKVK